jgi:hypothetical protein
MQAAIVALSVYILVSLTKRKKASVQILEYEERQSQAVDKNQRRNKESDFSGYK